MCLGVFLGWLVGCGLRLFACALVGWLLACWAAASVPVGSGASWALWTFAPPLLEHCCRSLFDWKTGWAMLGGLEPAPSTFAAVFIQARVGRVGSRARPACCRRRYHRPLLNDFFFSHTFSSTSSFLNQISFFQRHAPQSCTHQ